MTVVIGVVWLGLTMCEMRNHYVRYWWGVQCNICPCSADDGGDWCCVAGVDNVRDEEPLRTLLVGRTMFSVLVLLMTVVIGVVWLGLTMCEMRNHYVRYWWGVQCSLSLFC